MFARVRVVLQFVVLIVPRRSRNRTLEIASPPPGGSGVDGPPVQADRGRLSSVLLPLLRAVVVALAERLERTRPEPRLVTLMAFDVIADGCWGVSVLSEAHPAEGFGLEVLGAELLPAGGLVPPAVGLGFG